MNAFVKTNMQSWILKENFTRLFVNSIIPWIHAKQNSIECNNIKKNNFKLSAKKKTSIDAVLLCIDRNREAQNYWRQVPVNSQFISVLNKRQLFRWLNGFTQWKQTKPLINFIQAVPHKKISCFRFGHILQGHQNHIL